MGTDHQGLKAYQREHRANFAPGLALRTHRALSWFHRAEKERAGADFDAEFIFLWIAFNAAYAQDLSQLAHERESRRFSDFLQKLCDLDSERVLADMVWNEYPKAIRLLLDNKFVYQPFWDHHNGDPGAGDWEARFTVHKQAANRALGKGETSTVLSIAFSSLYTLRNQLVHGGATWQGRVNRDQVHLGCQLLRQLVPLAIDLMMRNPGVLWGDAAYPVVE